MQIFSSAAALLALASMATAQSSSTRVASSAASVFSPTSVSTGSATASSSAASSTSTSGSSGNSSGVGYNANYTSPNTPSQVSFGSNWAALNLDLQESIVMNVRNTSEGSTMLNSTVRWVEALANQTQNTSAESIRPLHIWTRIYYTNAEGPEAMRGTVKTPANMTTFPTNSTAGTAIAQEFQRYVDPSRDVVLAKQAFYAGNFNASSVFCAPSASTPSSSPVSAPRA